MAKTTKTEDSAFQSSDPEAQKYIVELAAINEKLHTQLLKCKTENISLKNRVKVIEKELEKERKEPKLSDLLEDISLYTTCLIL
jgi:hypothetical protein